MNESNATIEETFPLTVEANLYTSKVKFFLPAGEVEGCSIYPGPINNAGMVRASIKSISGEEISKLQHIENYRNRDAEYGKGFKPLSINGGKDYVYEIVSDQPFSADFHSDLIFYYKDTRETCKTY